MTASRPDGIAFFDFDNTLIHGDAGPLFGRHLYRRHLIGRGRLRRWGRYVPFVTWMAAQAVLYQVRARRRSSIVRSAYKGLRGVDAAAFHGELGHFVDAVVPPRIYPAMLDEVASHHAAGRRSVVVTTGMEALVARALEHFPDGMDLLGCRLEERGGRLTGRVSGPLYGADKANIIQAYCRASGVEPSACWAYSDHGSDRHMLEAVGHGVAVNPRGAFARLARKRGWRVMEMPDPREA